MMRLFEKFCVCVCFFLAFCGFQFIQARINFKQAQMGHLENVLLAVLAIILTSCLVYDRLYLESIKDVHELSLNEQTSISSTRKTGESAIYRSLDVMHGLPLTVGLQVRYDVYKIRNGNLKDVWSLAMERIDNKITFINDDKMETIEFGELNKMLYKLSLELNKVTKGKKIAIYSSFTNSNAFILLLSCFFHTKHTVQNLSKIPQIKNEDIELICCQYKDFRSFKDLGYDRFLFLDKNVDDPEVSSVSYSGLLDVEDSRVPSKFEYKSSKEDDFQTAFIDTINFKEIEYSQINFVSSIASQLRSLPMDHAWQPSDILMVEMSDQISSSSNFVLLNQNFLIKFLSALVAGVHEIIIVPERNCDISLVEKKTPTILSISEPLLHKNFGEIIGKEIDNLGFLQNQIFKLSSGWFSRGIYNSIFRHPSIPKLRIIYSEIYTESRLSSLLLNYIQSAFSTRLIVEKFKLPVLGPLLKTNFYDYRLLANDTDGNRLVLKKLGVPANCLEFKVKDSGNYEAEFEEGELVCRGFNIGKQLAQRVEELAEGEEAEGWMSLGIIGKWGEDGCFYEYI